MPEPTPPSSSSPPDTAGPPNHHALIVNSIDQGFCIIEMIFDDQGRPVDYQFVETNAAFAQQTGLVDARGRRMRELIPNHEDTWFEIYGEVALTGKPTRFVHESRVLERWFDLYAFRIDQPELRRVAVLFTDITERMRSERAARLLAAVSEDLISLTREADLPVIVRRQASGYFRLSQCAMVDVDVPRRVATVHQSWDLPTAPSVAGSHRFEDFVGEAIWNDALAGRTVVVDDVTNDPRVVGAGRFLALHIASFAAVALQKEEDRRQVFIFCRAEPGAWRADEIELARELGTRCWNRVARLRSENALRASEQRLRLILENAREYAIFSMDLDREVTSWSEGAERLLGYSEAEMLGESADRVFTPEDVASKAPAREAAIALQDGRASNERWHLRKDGTPFWGSGMMMAMRDETGGVYGLLKIMRDQTSVRLAQEALLKSQTQLQDALEQAQRARADAEAAGLAKDRFLAALSHELRTPLNPVLMIAGERAADLSLPPDLHDDFEMIKKNIELEARLIDDMLDLSRIVRGKVTLHQAPLDLHAILREVIEIVRPAAAEKGMQLTVDLASPHATVQGDPARLKQVFLNLLNNAIKFTTERGSIAVRSAPADKAAEIVVSIVDTGLGMTEEELARAFEPFTQGLHVNSASRSFGGLGLGLAIVQDLVNRHGGRVTAASRGRGQGSTFTVILPLCVAAPTDSRAPFVASVRPPDSLRILLVEDDAHTRRAMERMLGRRHFRVVSVGSRTEALQQAAVEPFDLVISDLGLPDGDGYQLMMELRTVQPTLRGIALSGFGMESDMARSSAAGFARHLIKPVTVQQIEAAIRDLRPANDPVKSAKDPNAK